jgi:quercetin dioxygenase-like cupin family protein
MAHINYKEEDLLRRIGEGEETKSGMLVKAGSKMLDGDFSVMEGVIKSGELIPPHTHEHESQLVYVIEGSLEFEVGGKEGLRFTADTGSYIIKPKGIMHSFWNISDSTVRYIELTGKSNFEDFIKTADNGHINALKQAKNFGLDFSIKDMLRLIIQNKLHGIAMIEMPKLPKAILEALNKFLVRK